MKHPHMMHTLEFRDVTFEHGDGAVLYGRRGNSHTLEPFLDFFADVGTSSLGYSTIEQRRALSRMVVECIPVHAPNLYRYKERDKAAERITRITGMDRVFMCNSGAESVEGALKLARKFQSDRGDKRLGVYTAQGGFHGRTYAGISAGDGPPYHTAGFGPLLPHFHHFKDIEEILPEDAGIIMLAPIMGNNDVQMYPEGWLEQLRAFATQHNIILIFDEVQTGSGRCGTPTYAQKCGVKPDIITLAKGIGMGCPVGVVLATEEVAAAFTPGSHFSTFGGNPLSCVFINAMLDWLEEPANLRGVEEKGDAIMQRLRYLSWPQNIRGSGMLIAFDVDIDGIEFAMGCLDKGLLIGAFRKGAGAVKITPPLNIDDKLLYSGMDTMDSVYRSIKGKQ